MMFISMVVAGILVDLLFSARVSSYAQNDA
jgi:hypothetical protein